MKPITMTILGGRGHSTVLVTLARKLCVHFTSHTTGPGYLTEFCNASSSHSDCITGSLGADAPQEFTYAQKRLRLSPTHFHLLSDVVALWRPLVELVVTQRLNFQGKL